MGDGTSSQDVLSASYTAPPADRGMAGRNKPEQGSSNADLSAIIELSRY